MPKKLTVVGFDIDSTLANLTDTMTQLIEEELHIHVPTSAVTEWNFYVKILGSVKAMLDVMDQAWAESVIAPQEPGLPDTIARLNPGKYHRMIISSRTYESHPHVVQWLHDHEIVYDALALTSSGLEKFEYPIDILVDDRPSFATDIAEYPDKFLYLRDHPWNQDVELPENALRVASVAEAVDHILSSRKK